MVGYLYDLIISIPVSIVLALLLHEGFIDASQRGAVCFTIVVVAVLYSSVKYIKSKARGLIYLIPLVGYAKVLVAENKYNVFIEYQWILWSVLLAVLGILIARLSAINKWTIRVICVASLGYLGYYINRGNKADKVVVAFAFFLILVTVVSEIQMRWKKKGFTEVRSHVVFLAPFIIVPCLIIGLSNAPTTPYEWKFLEKLWIATSDTIKAQINKLRGGDDEYWNNYVGFNDTGRLSESLQIDAKNLFKMVYERRAESPLYLKGHTYDTFDISNLEWVSNYDEAHDDYLMDTMETLAAINNYDSIHSSRYIREVSLNVRFDMFRTNSVFLPNKTRQGSDRINDMGLLYRGDNYTFTKQRGYGTKYDVEYYMINRTNPEIYDIINGASTISSSIWSGIDAKYFSRLDCDKSYDSYLRYQERMHDVYLEDIQLSDELSAYMDTVLEGAETDIEKLDRIQELLCSYTYTLNPGKVPDDIDTPSEYLDYFILEKKEGYCSYYATAFVLLARAEGIPARYVEGFYITKGRANTIMVTSDMAHAWAEIYIDGFGWIVYDATPGFTSYSGWDAEGNRTNSSSISGNEVSTSSVATEATGSQTNTEDESSDEAQEDFETPVKINWKPIAVGTAFIIFIVALIYVVDRLTVKLWFKKLDGDRKHMVIYHRVIKVLKVLGYVRESGETLEEFSERINYTRTADNSESYIPEDIKQFLADREEVVYAEKHISEKEIEQAMSAYRLILYTMKIRRKWFIIRRMLIERIE